MFLAGGNKKEEQNEGLPGSIAARRGAYLTRLARGRTEASRGIEGTKSKEGEQNRWRRNKIAGGTKSIFRLRYQIASYTGYIGNLAPSPKHETNTTTDGSAQGEPEYMCNDEMRTGICDSGRRETKSIGGE
jgi:hypothetical protein